MLTSTIAPSPVLRPHRPAAVSKLSPAPHTAVSGVCFRGACTKSHMLMGMSCTSIRPRMAPCQVFPFDQAWAPNVDAQSLAPGLFAASLFPYLAFLYYLTRTGKEVPRLTLFGFYFLLVFVGATIPAGIYAKVQYGTSLANVDWLHGTAESMLTVTNLLIVLGLRQGIRDAKQKKASEQTDMKEETSS